MNNRVAAVMVHVPDWREGFAWYRKAFPSAQVRSLPDIDWRCLEVDGVSIEVVNADEKVSPGTAGTIVYWCTTDLDARLDYLLSIGATLFRGPMAIESGQRICQVVEPSGTRSVFGKWVGKVMQDELFRLAFGSRHNPEVDRWFDARPDELGHLARRWFNEMRSLGDDVLELIHDGCPVACIEDAPFCYVNTFSSHTNVGFFTGAFLDDRAGLLQGTGKRMRHVKVSPIKAYDEKALRKLIFSAYEDMKKRVEKG